MKLVEDRNKSGLASDPEERRVELNLYRTESFLPVLQAQLTAAINPLSVLPGEPPNALYSEPVAAKPIPAGKDQIFIGIPGHRVRRRPDIRAAKRSLASQTAKIRAGRQPETGE